MEPPESARSRRTFEPSGAVKSGADDSLFVSKLARVASCLNVPF